MPANRIIRSSPLPPRIPNLILTVRRQRCRLTGCSCCAAFFRITSSSKARPSRSTRYAQHRRRTPSSSTRCTTTEMPPHRLLMLRRFFQDYKQLEGKAVEVDEIRPASEAYPIILDALHHYRDAASQVAHAAPLFSGLQAARRQGRRGRRDTPSIGGVPHHPRRAAPLQRCRLTGCSCCAAFFRITSSSKARPSRSTRYAQHRRRTPSSSTRCTTTANNAAKALRAQKPRRFRHQKPALIFPLTYCTSIVVH